MQFLQQFAPRAEHQKEREAVENVNVRYEYNSLSSLNMFSHCSAENIMEHKIQRANIRSFSHQSESGKYCSVENITGGGNNNCTMMRLLETKATLSTENYTSRLLIKWLHTR